MCTAGRRTRRQIAFREAQLATVPIGSPCGRMGGPAAEKLCVNGSHEKGRGDGYRLEYAASSGVQLERELEKREHHPVATDPITQNDDHP